MKKTKRIVACLLCAVLIIGAVPAPALAASVARDTAFENSLAVGLKNLGLFQGVSDTDFDLNRSPKRLEAIVMLIRVLGKENEALGGTWAHPFTDVESWAGPYIGYAYANGLTSGESSTQFGVGDADAATYLTFVLRALGYSDAAGDFTWNNPFSLAKSVGILPSCVKTDSFLRADVVLVSYAALSAKLKGSSQTLAQKLIASGVFTQAQYGTYYDAEAITEYLGSNKTELTTEQIYAQCSPAVFYIEVCNSKGTAVGSGSGFFIDANGTAVTNYHVIEGAYSATITVSDTGKTYRVLGVYTYSEEEDWAVLKIEGAGFSYLTLSEAAPVGGATVVAIGSPLGLQNTITPGIVSNPSRKENGLNYIQTSAAISPGSSGGALIDKYGEVIGITSASYTDGQNLNLALPVSYIKKPSQTSVQTLAELADKMAANPIKAVGKYLIRHGDYDDSSDQYYLTESLSDADYYMIYAPGSNQILIGIDYGNYNGAAASALIVLDGVKEKYLFLTMIPSQLVKATGYLTAAAFNASSTLTFETYSGLAANRAKFNKTSVAMLCNVLDVTQSLFDYYGMPISILDFGFIAEYNSYNTAA